LFTFEKSSPRANYLNSRKKIEEGLKSLLLLELYDKKRELE
jgi:hypothetical protein